MKAQNPSSERSATAFAPATVANVAVGFDLLGFAVDSVGDEATVTIRSNDREVELLSITGAVTDLPKNPEKNTATLGLQKMIAELNLPFGFSVSLKKGIPLSSGMGGSAASAVAAVVAANELLDRSLSREALLPFALAGEAVASGSVHGDNVAPCLFGGLVLALPEPAHGSEHSNLKIVQVPVPDGIVCILVHPEMRIETREARAILRPELPLRSHIQQSACLSGFLAGCYQKDLGLIRAFLRDELIEPQRARLIPGFSELKRLALENGALGFSISGAGPSVFAWAENRDSAQKIEHALVKVFKENGLASQSWVSPVMPQGARRIS